MKGFLLGGQGSDTHITGGNVLGFGLITREGHACKGKPGEKDCKFICLVPSSSSGGEGVSGILSKFFLPISSYLMLH